VRGVGYRVRGLTAMGTHVLKTWPEFYQPIVCGEKTTELRKNDRNFKVGDELRLREFDPKTKRYSGHEASARIIGIILKSPGLTPDYCAISIKLIRTHFNGARAGKKR